MRPAVLLLPLLLLCATAPPAQAWLAGEREPHHADLAVLAALRLPEPHRALVLQHEAAFRRGAQAPDLDVHTFFHGYEPADGGGGGVYALQRALRDAALALRGPDAEEAAYRLGVLTHFSLDLSVPFHTGENAYGHPLHERFETLAHAHAAELVPAAAGAPQEVTDPEARTLALARASADLAPDLLDALARSGGAWSPEVAQAAREAAALGLDATADFLLTAFLWADPARGGVPRWHADDLPLPKDLEDMGWEGRTLARWGLVGAMTLVALPLLGASVRAARRRVRT